MSWDSETSWVIPTKIRVVRTPFLSHTAHKTHSLRIEHTLTETKYAMKTAAPEQSIASFGSNSANPSSTDYTSNQSSSFTPRPSQVIDMSFPNFPFPGVESPGPESRPSPVRRPSKLNLLSKLFSSSKRDLKESKKPGRALGKDRSAASPTSTKEASSTTLHLSRDAKDVFGNLQQPQGVKQGRGIVRQMSEDSMIGSVLEIPSSNSSTLEETAEEACITSPSSSTRPKLPQKAASFRTPARSHDFTRTTSARSVAFQAPRPSPSPPLAVSRVPPQQQEPSRTVEISPGNFQTLRGHQETLRYVRRDEVASTTCLSCSDTIYAINDAAMVVCPTCRSITPMRSEGDGLALGFTAHEWLDIQREALAMRC